MADGLDRDSEDFDLDQDLDGQDANKERQTSFLGVLSFVYSYWRRNPFRLAWIFGLMALATAADAMLPWASGRLIDALAAGSETEEAVASARTYFLVFIALAAMFYLVRNSSFRMWILFAAHNMSLLVSEAFNKAQSFSSDWHANNFAGATVRKISRGMWAYDTVSDVLLIGIFSPLLVIAAITAQMAWRWPLVGLVMAISVIGFVIMSAVLSLKYIAPANKISNDADSKIGAALADAITCNTVVKSFGAETREEERFFGIAEAWRRKVSKTWMRYINMWLIQNLSLVTMQAVVMGLSVWQWSQGRATAGDVTFVITSFFIVNGYMRELGDNLQQLQRGVNELDDVAVFRAQAPDVADAAGATNFVPGRGEIVFDQVRFGYAGQAHPIYDDFSLRIAPGERVALVGPSGSGKSTFVKLVQRLYDVESGDIRIDGQSVRKVRQTSLRSQIALVPQDPALFHRTLAENIAYSRPDASEAEIIAAAKRAHAHEFVMRLPDGYGTLVGERGVKLSGGERQRIAIARAFLADAPILVLDEATSSLDSITESEIQMAMDELIRGRTAILIAHRLSTVRDADRILVFDQGRVIEEGRHDDLLRRPRGRYRELHELQGAA